MEGSKRGGAEIAGEGAEQIEVIPNSEIKIPFEPQMDADERRFGEELAANRRKESAKEEFIGFLDS